MQTSYICKWLQNAPKGITIRANFDIIGLNNICIVLSSRATTNPIALLKSLKINKLVTD